MSRPRTGLFTVEQDKILADISAGSSSRAELLKLSEAWQIDISLLKDRRVRLRAQKAHKERYKVEVLKAKMLYPAESKAKTKVFDRPAWFNEDINMLARAWR